MIRSIVLAVVLVAVCFWFASGPLARLVIDRQLQSVAQVDFDADSVTAKIDGVVAIKNARFQLPNNDAIISAKDVLLKIDRFKALSKRLEIQAVTMTGLKLPYDPNSSKLASDLGQKQECEMLWQAPESNAFEDEKRWKLISPELKSWDDISSVNQSLDEAIRQVSFTKSSIQQSATLMLQNTPSFDNPLRSETLRETTAVTKDLLQKISELQKNLKDVHVEHSQRLTDVRESFKQDLQRLTVDSDFTNQDPTEIAYEILTKFAIKKLNEVQPYVAALQGITSIDGDAAQEAQIGQGLATVIRTSRGSDFRFESINRQPDWLIRNAIMKGEFVQGDSAAKFEGRASGLTRDTSLTGKPMVIRMRVNPFGGEVVAELQRHRSENSDLSSIALFAQYEQPATTEIENQQDAIIRFASRSENHRLNLTQSIDVIEGTFTINASDCKIELVGKSNSEIRTPVEIVNSLSGDVELRFRVSSEPNAITEIKVNSLLIDPISAYFAKIVAQPSSQNTALQLRFECDYDQLVVQTQRKAENEVRSIENELESLETQLREASNALISRVQGFNSSSRTASQPDEKSSVR